MVGHRLLRSLLHELPVLFLLISYSTIPAAEAWVSLTAIGTSSRVVPTKARLYAERRLENVICLVTGASRGIGKGIALELGAEGAIVYITGTTTTTNAGTLSSEAPGTIEETAKLISDSGGTCIPVLCDHSHVPTCKG
jgi:hypothetical protein